MKIYLLKIVYCDFDCYQEQNIRAYTNRGIAENMRRSYESTLVDFHALHDKVRAECDETWPKMQKKLEKVKKGDDETTYRFDQIHEVAEIIEKYGPDLLAFNTEELQFVSIRVEPLNIINKTIKSGNIQSLIHRDSSFEVEEIELDQET